MDEIGKAYKDLKAKGVKFITEPKTSIWAPEQRL
jgi:hypothetical protein